MSNINQRPQIILFAFHLSSRALVYSLFTATQGNVTTGMKLTMIIDHHNVNISSGGE